MILVNNQLGHNYSCMFISILFFVNVYFCSLHVSDSYLPIIRRIIVSVRHLVYVTLKQVNNLKLRNGLPENDLCCL